MASKEASELRLMFALGKLAQVIIATGSGNQTSRRWLWENIKGDSNGFF